MDVIGGEKENKLVLHSSILLLLDGEVVDQLLEPLFQELV